MIDLFAGVFDAPTLILSKTKSTLSVLYVLFVEDRRRLLVLLLGAVIVCDVRRAVDMILYRRCYSNFIFILPGVHIKNHIVAAILDLLL